MTEAIETSEKSTKKKSNGSSAEAPTQGRKDAFMYKPEDLTLVTDESHPLYDERIHLPVDESMVLNIMEFGVMETVLVAKDNDTGKTVVIDGRQRVKCAIEANKRLRKAGAVEVLIPALSKRADARNLASMMVSANEIRKDDTPLGRARKMQHLLDLGVAEEDLPVRFGCSGATIKNTLSLLEVSAPVQRAVESGKLGISQAYKLSKVEPEEQKAKLEEIIAAGEGGGTKREKARAKNAVIDSDKPKMRRRGEVEALLSEASDPLIKSVLKWVLGVRKNPPAVGEE